MSPAYRIQNQDALNFLTLTIVDWIDLFTRERNRRIIIESLEYCRKNKGLRIWAYVIMTNHVHLIVSAEAGNISDLLRDFKRHTARRLIEAVMDSAESRKEWILNRFSRMAKKPRWTENNYQVWIHNNHAVELETSKFLRQKMAYIHNNPVSAGFVDDPGAWVYSSQRNYMGEMAVLDIDLLDF